MCCSPGRHPGSSVSATNNHVAASGCTASACHCSSQLMARLCALSSRLADLKLQASSLATHVVGEAQYCKQGEVCCRTLAAACLVSSIALCSCCLNACTSCCSRPTSFMCHHDLVRAGEARGIVCE